MKFIILLVFCFFVLLVPILIDAIRSYYIEKEKYKTLRDFLMFKGLSFQDDVIPFIDSLHFNDREKSLATKYKLLYKDLSRIRNKKK